jgi:serine/threonine protein kinase
VNTDPTRVVPPSGAPTVTVSGPRGTVGRFDVLGELGRGGMGAVYRARDPELGREVALKVLLPELATDPKAKARFLREARPQARVEHDHIVPIHDVGETGGFAYLVMPLLKGQSLRDALKKNARPPVSEVVRIGREIAEGLAAAHAAGLIHRDIKPGNIWLEGDRRRVKILDFGLARATGDAPDEHAAARPKLVSGDLTAAGGIVGTPPYMSPEQARGLPTDARSDVFSLGTVLYELLAGRKPFTGPSAFDIMAAVASDEPVPLPRLVPDLPPALADLVARMLAKDPAARTQSCAEVAAALAALAVPQVVVLPLNGGAPNVWEDLTAAESDTGLSFERTAADAPPGAPAPRAPQVAVAGGRGRGGAARRGRGRTRAARQARGASEGRPGAAGEARAERRAESEREGAATGRGRGGAVRRNGREFGEVAVAEDRRRSDLGD